ncbi:MAG: hypothetical protein RL150_626 [Candidatus Parcubacteria bacterium]|jgi:methylenetetrahydrofolate dehydrogenase (NADP+)/methenyltetrahydrofolate cyclohydrolase
MILLDGQTLADTKKQTLTQAVAALSITPQLAIVQVGDDQASSVYVGRKETFGKEIGTEVAVHKLPADTTTEVAVELVRSLSENHGVHGIIVQLPVPAHINKELVINAISPEKDVDGLTARNLWNLMDDKRGIVPATARGVATLLTAYNVDLEGSHVVIVGDSLLVGKSCAVHFLNQNATVTVCHDKTKNLSSFTKQADILVVAVGKPGLISNLHVTEGQVVVDVGITRLPDGKVVGDVDFESVKGVVGAVTPVPGGVGPLTVVSLFENLLAAVAPTKVGM